MLWKRFDRFRKSLSLPLPDSALFFLWRCENQFDLAYRISSAVEPELALDGGDLFFVGLINEVAVLVLCDFYHHRLCS